MSEVKTSLIPQHEMFCQLFVSQEFFANGAKSYLQVYPNSSEKNASGSARDLLAKPSIQRRINELIDQSGLTDSFVDKQLLFCITQMVDLKAKLAAIKEYNRLRGRVIERVDVTSYGDRMSINNAYTVIVNGEVK